MRTISVNIPNAKYHVYIERGCLSSLIDKLDPQKKYVIITDDGVPQIYIDQLLSSKTIQHVLVFKQGESHKTLDTVSTLIHQLQMLHITRDDCLIALGGGIVGDVTGFVASIYLRGMDYINIPTTLLSQIDSSVGGKVGVNTPIAKNAIGQFKQPKAVYIDPNCLNTLSKRQFNNGVAELIKHAIIQDKQLFKDLCQYDFNQYLEDFICRSIQIKKAIVIQDVYDLGQRQLLNFGHTIGHAIEKASHHSILHGEAIAIGMVQMAKNCDQLSEIKTLLKRFELPTACPYTFEELENYMSNDKKLKQAHLTLVLVNDIGNAYLQQGKVSDLKNYL